MTEILREIQGRSTKAPITRALARLGSDADALLGDEIHAWKVTLAEKKIEP